MQHRIIDLVKNKKGGRRGYHQIGGKKPSDFVIPRTKDIGDFQYLGFLSNEDPTFNWLGLIPFGLSNIFKLPESLFGLFKLLNPTIINIEGNSNSDTSFDFLNSSFFINFKEYNCHFEGAVNYGYGMAHSGIPEWIQYPYFPRCPKTNKILRFVCQLKSSGGVMVEETNAVLRTNIIKAILAN
ncbi:MAG: hypothetical protein IPO04_06030 [Cytophagaceae bacterium]|nr:hypothetical protein [Cytophagaceae bacterium]